MSHSRLVGWKCKGGTSSGGSGEPTSIYGYASIIQWDTTTIDDNPWTSGEGYNMRPQGNVVLNACITSPANFASDVTPTPLSGSQPTPPVIPTTATFNCTDSRTAYDAGSPKWYNANDHVIRQGFLNMGTSGNNEQYGCFWFDLRALSGKTISSASLTLTRISGYGRSSEVSVHLYTTSLTGPGGSSLGTMTDRGTLGTIANGETKTFSIPTAAISSSQNAGFMLRVDDGSVISGRGYSTNYANFYGDGDANEPVLTVAYTG